MNGKQFLYHGFNSNKTYWEIITGIVRLCFSVLCSGFVNLWSPACRRSKQKAKAKNKRNAALSGWNYWFTGQNRQFSFNDCLNSACSISWTATNEGEQVQMVPDVPQNVPSLRPIVSLVYQWLWVREGTSNARWISPAVPNGKYIDMCMCFSFNVSHKWTICTNFEKLSERDGECH